jgi:site-specific recombinase XerD
MRHDFCTQLVKKGIDIYTVQRLAGHADIRTTMRYVHALLIGTADEKYPHHSN